MLYFICFCQSSLNCATKLQKNIRTRVRKDKKMVKKAKKSAEYLQIWKIFRNFAPESEKSIRNEVEKL